MRCDVLGCGAPKCRGVMGFFDRIRQSLTRTKERFEEVARLSDAPGDRHKPVDVETIEALEEALISADVGVAAADQIVTAVGLLDRSLKPANVRMLGFARRQKI